MPKSSSLVRIMLISDLTCAPMVYSVRSSLNMDYGDIFSMQTYVPRSKCGSDIKAHDNLIGLHVVGRCGSEIAQSLVDL